MTPQSKAQSNCNLSHSTNVFITIIMPLLRDSPADRTRAEQPARCNLLHENYHNNTQSGGERHGEVHANGTAVKEDRRPNQAVI